jgi:hypothetical protein
LTTIKLNVNSAEEFREQLPSSGLFDLTDCDVKINASWDSSVADLQLITLLLESAINIVDFNTDIEAREGIEVIIKSVPLKRARNSA